MFPLNRGKDANGLANRIYIAIGLIAILLLGGAFVVPWFIDWNAYKPRMEQMAAEALGVEVEIAGDMDFTLLPQPRMHFENARLGPADAPVGSARLVEADLSLMDFLRDRFTVTQLRLIEPELNLVIDEEGQLQTPITLAQSASVTNVSIADARLTDGVVRLTDLRSGESWQAERFNGDMALTGVRGPFALQGQAVHDGAGYGVRVSTSAMNAAGQMQVSAFVRPSSGAFSVTAEGLLETGGAPSLTGTLAYRQAAPADQGEAVVGGMTLESPLVADAERIELSEFVLLPDENQTATRLTGQARLSLGAEPAFEATVSGGVVALQPRAVTDEGTQPFEIVRLLRGMPEPLMPPLPGRVAMSINEFSVRGMAVRDVRLDATSDGDSWTIEEFSGRLSGDTTLKLTGQLGRAAGWPAFEGTLSMASPRLDALSLLWRRAGDDNPLFGMGGSLNGRLQLVNDRLRFSDGLLVLDETVHTVSGDMRFGDTPSLNVTAGLSALDGRQSTALLALLPPIDPAGAFGLSFPQGRLDLDVEAARLSGMALRELSLRSAWSAEGLELESLALGSYGGVGFEGAGRLSGTLAAPVIAGEGEMDIASNAPAIGLLAGEDNPLRQGLLGSLPAHVSVALEAPGREGVQSLRLEGRAGAADISGRLEMTGGITGLGRENLVVVLEAAAESGSALLDQLGLAPLIAGEDGAIASARLEGNPRGNMDAEFSLEGGGERIDFSGTLVLSDLSSIRGEGQTSFLFADGVALAELAEAQGIWFPGLEGQANIGFVGDQSVTLSDISAFAAERAITGTLSYAAQRDTAVVTGALGFDGLDIETVAAMLAGPAGVLNLSPGMWPDGPIDLGANQRATRGRIAITAPVLMAGEERLIEALAFDYTWGEEDVGLRGLFGEFGGGTIQLDATVCCTSALADKNLSGRLTLNGVAIDAALPDTPADVLGGTLTLGLQFQGSGDSYRAFAGSLNGEGSFSVEDLRIEGLSPDAFQAAANVDNLIEIEPEALEILVATALQSGPFESQDAGGLVRLIGGAARIANIAINGGDARLVGGGSLDVETAALEADWTLALTRVLAGNGLITETTGRIGVGIEGTLLAPERSLDLGPMVDAIQMRAYEIELDELEALRAEQEARQRAAAEEQARLMEEEARRQAELLLQEQQEEAERLRIEEQQRQLEELENQLLAPGQVSPEPEEEGAQNPSSSFLVLPPGSLELQSLSTGR
ncbi:AsmA family protein [Pelagibacterium halotolerans]|uniref:AsmA family protein n=1 Tax=Pelagibacterium halotolerans TaxID=531813 RepID=UPI000897FD80|nr:AsmA family protein [Pelagibacterium halotolerans]QJR18237.1 AsmA family protein [Pelagibacterium halotolerans]SDZ80758.1 AsmA-like C-terminal region [Pelagibacterium halotolerans]